METTRIEALRSAPMDTWVALADDESRIVATGSSFSEAQRLAAEKGVTDPIILKTPLEWIDRVLLA